MKELIQNDQIKKLLEKYKTIWALGHFAALGSWDMEVNMPEKGIEARSEALGKVASFTQEKFLEKDFVKLIEDCAKMKDLNDYEKGVVRMLERGLDSYQKLPKEFIEEYAKATSKGSDVWKKARAKENFSMFEPYLEKIIELSRQKAKYLGYKDHPYDALLDEYEENLTTKQVEEYFATIKEPIVNLVKYIVSSKKYEKEHPLEKETYETKPMEEFSKKLLDILEADFSRFRLDISTHPFTTEFGQGDTRITTRYEGSDFANSYGSTIHEFGHALYEMQIADGLAYTPIGGGSSLVIHESQSRFWENFVGKSKDFLERIKGDLAKVNKNFGKYSTEELYKYVNLVKPGFIRVEADEVTYHLHILIRFEIEKGLLEGSIKVKDLPTIWNTKYKEYLGVDVPNDRVGVLQDVHWSQGYVGYFPTYSMGTSLSCMWKHYFEKDLGDLSELIKKKDGINKIKKWLAEHIHQYGSTYTFNELVKKSCGEKFDSKYLIEFLEKKYKEIY